MQFKITYANGSYLPDEGGKLSSNGLYWTNEEGQIVLSGINGTVVVTEVESIPGYTIDPDTQSQTVVVNPDDTQQLYFYNAPWAVWNSSKSMTQTGQSASPTPPLRFGGYRMTLWWTP